MTVVDSSVVVAAFASWHDQHRAADAAVAGARLIAHCAMEAYSVLTRLPPPHRAAGGLVSEFLVARFPDPYVSLDPRGYRDLLPRLVELGVSGGSAYDALVAATAAAAGATLLSCDRRAAQIYERLGADFDVLG